MSAASSTALPRVRAEGLAPVPKDDRHDRPVDLALWPQLAEKLRVCAGVVEPAFREADAAALRHQSDHRLLIKLATVFGTAAMEGGDRTCMA